MLTGAGLCDRHYRARTKTICVKVKLGSRAAGILDSKNLKFQIILLIYFGRPEKNYIIRWVATRVEEVLAYVPSRAWKWKLALSSGNYHDCHL